MKISLTIRVTFIVTVASFMITLLAGLSAQIRWLSLLQRTAVSVVFFSLVGYLAGKWWEKRLYSILPPPNVPDTGEKIDVISESPQENLESFDPFTIDHFKKIVRK